MESYPSIPSRHETISIHKGKGGMVAAVFPIHYPRALLRAFDVLPVEVWGPPGIHSRGSITHFQPYVCSIVQNGLSFLLSGGLDEVDLLIVPHACDSLQGLGSVLIDFVRPKQPVIPIYLPRGRRPSDIDFFTSELRDLYHQLEALTGVSPSEDILMHCIQQEEQGNLALQKLHNNRRRLPLDNQGFYHLARSREYLPVEDFIQLTKQVLEHPHGDRAEKITVVVSGIIVEPRGLLQSLKEHDCLIVADDLACCGRRLYPPGTSNEPLRRLAESLLNGPPDSTRGDSIAKRSEHLIQLVQSNGARGVIFYGIKFCEPELFDLPQLRQALNKADIPSNIIEVDINDQDTGRIITRLAAFLETIQ